MNAGFDKFEVHELSNLILEHSKFLVVGTFRHCPLGEPSVGQTENTRQLNGFEKEG